MLCVGYIFIVQSVLWVRVVVEDGGFKICVEFDVIYCDGVGFWDGDDVVVYCWIGECLSYIWFVFKYFLGFENVCNYDGFWIEWGSVVCVFIVMGIEFGFV